MTLSKHPAPIGFIRDLIAIGICFVVIATTVNAESLSSKPITDSDPRVATSIGTYLGPQNLPSKRPQFDSPVTKRARTEVRRALYSNFEIYDAYANLYYDDDFDGHYYALEVTFDADTNYAVADVFARLYLSFEGGPWEHYYTTDVFTIFGDSSDDLYTVDTELFTGYPTGYYDVLIELFDADYDDFLAAIGPADAPDLRNLPLEDQTRDKAFIGSPAISFSHGGGGGSVSLLGIAVLGMVAVRRQRKATRSALTQTAQR